MLALLDGEDVSLLLRCGIAERSHDASCSPTRQALSSCTAEGSFSAPSPIFKIPSWVSYHHSLCPRLCDSAHCPLPVLIRSINNWAHVSRPPSPMGQTPIQLITVCSRWQTLELGVGLWHPRGILLPSHCPPVG